eukprot:CAMPEP_0116872916 /NCGR_PEP_ID=MMETSP0463-20121206/3844_1 /TAXON_ID=181622 /ORGANISM="Strombidinopsis sp, Strain SopsisLIS2011" /LENGTH=65 /DNA_ID=CAMNT_0004513971 /DNA_START=268 /DNA_END=465 /DNA_ORIENTATION=+
MKLEREGEPDPAELADITDIDQYSMKNSEKYTSMLNSHLLGPLFDEFEKQMRLLERDAKKSKLEV